MELLTPKLGLFFWSLVIFVIFAFILGKFAWKPIINGLRKREETIENSLREADRAREEMARLQADNERLLQEARAERDAMLKEAREAKDKIVGEARDEAKRESARIIEGARKEIEAEKLAALTELKNQVGQLSIEVAEKLLRQELSNQDKQKEVVDRLVADMSLN